MSGVQFGPKSNALFQNQTSAQHEFDLKSQVWFQTKIAWHKVHLLFCYITKFSGSDTGFPSLYKCFVDPVVSWFVEIWKQSCFSFSCSFIGVFKQPIIGCSISVKLPSWPGKRCNLYQKNGAICKKPMGAKQITRITSDFKMDAINVHSQHCLSSIFHKFCFC